MQFVLTLPANSNRPVYKQVSEALRQAILAGRLRPGERLPSTRDLSESVNISRFTVIRSYEELSSQGYIQTISGSGTFVSKEIPKEFSAFAQFKHDKDSTDNRVVQLSKYGRRITAPGKVEAADAELFAELNYGASTQVQLPLGRWREVLNKVVRFQEPGMFDYISDTFGYMPLREAIAGYLIRARLVKCAPEQIVLFASAQSALDLIARLLVDADDSVAVENPGSPGARRAFLSLDAKLYPIAIERNGLAVEHLYQPEEKVKLVYVTPSHQDPTGVTMSYARRLELIKWAERTDGWIIEDDSDSEFRYGDKPIPAMQGLDEHDRVIYLNSFRKVLFPMVKMGFMVVPRCLVAPVLRCKSLIDRESPVLEQHALTHFINEGHLERHIRRSKALYAKRRAALVQVLTRLFKRRITISEVSAGMHIVVTFSQEFSEQNIIEAALAAKAPIVSTAAYYIDKAPPGQFMIAFAHISEQQITRVIEQFAAALMQNEQSGSSHTAGDV